MKVIGSYKAMAATTITKTAIYFETKLLNFSNEFIIMTSPFTSLHIFKISVICIILQLDINVKPKLKKTDLVVA